MTIRLDPAPLVKAGGGHLRNVARALDIDPSNLCRPITIWQADRWATAIGRHPVELWPDWFRLGIEPDDEAA